MAGGWSSIASHTLHRACETRVGRLARLQANETYLARGWSARLQKIFELRLDLQAKGALCINSLAGQILKLELGCETPYVKCYVVQYFKCRSTREEPHLVDWPDNNYYSKLSAGYLHNGQSRLKPRLLLPE